MSEAHTDFAKAFVHGSVIERPGEVIRIEVLLAGELDVPSGRVIAGDPESGIFCELERRIAPGRYPVWISLSHAEGEDGQYGSCVTCAKIQLSRCPPVEWRRLGFHGVDSGTAAFLDSHTAHHLMADNDHRHVWSESVARKRGMEHSWAEEMPGAVLFRSGFGDGSYDCYEGLDAAGSIAAFAIDFRVLMDPVTAEIGLKLDDLRASMELHHPDLAKFGLRMFSEDGRVIRMDVSQADVEQLCGFELEVRVEQNAVSCDHGLTWPEYYWKLPPLANAREVLLVLRFQCDLRPS